LNDAKFGLYKEVKVLQEKLADPKLVLNAFILSATKFSDLLNVSNQYVQADLEDHHVLFMDTSGQGYLTGMFERMVK
jgi:hypothetical protein